MAVQRNGAEFLDKLAETSEPIDLYQHDYYAWVCTQVEALREHKVAALDWENLAEEVEDLGKAERHRLESHLEGLMMHLLKWRYQPQRRSRSWTYSIKEHRFRIRKVLRDNPSLKSALVPILADAYEGARISAENETGMDPSVFPESCPWSAEDSIRDDFWPEA
ncbi:MAG TPA: DUF29 domain-containing protein [Candidatus Binataceae bacterium]|nr:DUF29 domain-containing protein [Candidatus Binataceae bacterium]